MAETIIRELIAFSHFILIPFDKINRFVQIDKIQIENLLNWFVQIISE